MGATQKGVGWIAQVQLDDGTWISWTQWKQRERADQHVAALLRDKRHVAGRVVRVDWTVVSEAAA